MNNYYFKVPYEISKFLKTCYLIKMMFKELFVTENYNPFDWSRKEIIQPNKQFTSLIFTSQ